MLVPQGTPGGQIQQTLDTLGLFKEFSEGAIAIDINGRVIWINEKYAELLSIEDMASAVGKPIEAIIPESKLPEVAQTGEPVLLDIMRFGNRHFVVCRLPTRNEYGEVTGAMGFVFFGDVEKLNPLLKKFSNLERELIERDAELRRMRKAMYTISSFLGTSDSVTTIRKRARMVAAHNSPVLLQGETGVGKELLAHGIHLASKRAQGPFVAINAASFLEESFEAQFFGKHSVGGDGQTTYVTGQLMLADGGTLFIDELGNMPLSIQAKFLRVIEDGVVEAVGGRTLKVSDFRLISTSSSDLERGVQAGTFREDLYYRLAVLPISIPALRSRIEDVDLLAETALDRLRLVADNISLSDQALLLMKEHTWPGNVRELFNVIERASVESNGEEIGVREMALALNLSSGSIPRFEHEGSWISLSENVRRAEKSAIIDALLRCHGNKDEAARQLGISRSNLYSKLKALGVDDI